MLHLNNHGMIGAELNDLERAFDSVWLHGLFYKLIKKDFSEYIIKLLWSMMQDRTLVTSEEHKVSEGLPCCSKGP